MLISIWSDKFIQDGKQRPPIVFHGGLNMIEGGAKAENSIGKSTLLYIIDFVFAGKDFFSNGYHHTSTSCGTPYDLLHAQIW